MKQTEDVSSKYKHFKMCDLTFLYYPRGGGIKTYIDTKRDEFRRRGIHHVLIAPNTKKSYSIQKENDGTLTTYYLPSFKIPSGGVEYFIFRHFRDIESVILQEKPSAIEIGDKFITLFFDKCLKRLKERAGAKMFCFSHERADNYIETAYHLYGKHSFLNSIKRMFFVSFEKMLMRRFTGTPDEILCNSAFTAEEIYPLTSKPVHVVPLGLNPEDFIKEKYYSKNLREKFSNGNAKKILIHVGRIDREKRIEVLVEFARLLNPKRYTLVVVGGGSEEKKLKKIPCAHVTGFVEPQQVRKYLAIADLGVLVNDIEPFGLVALEMMAFGLPILGPDKGGLSGILKDDFSWKLPYEARAYLRALEQWEKRDKNNLSLHAMEEFQRNYTSEKMVDTLLDIYTRQKSA